MEKTEGHKCMPESLPSDLRILQSTPKDPTNSPPAEAAPTNISLATNTLTSDKLKFPPSFLPLCIIHNTYQMPSSRPTDTAANKVETPLWS